MNNAVVTIVSRNYLSFARVLAKSLRQFNPTCSVYVFLCDKISDIGSDNEVFEFITIDDVQIPHSGAFFAQYTVLEANTAVKPFVLSYLLGIGYAKIIYLDPDIEIFGSLDPVWDLLDSVSYVLTPHMRRPFDDDLNPSEQTILQSGTFNLGFLAISESSEARSLLLWWQEKLFRECIVDTARGLFVDQKWMDLAPNYFPHYKMLRDPGYNVAYWNLHERPLAARAGGGYVVDGAPLRFFHFSGYSPLNPYVLSKHQNRHSIKNNPALLKICEEYGEKLIDEGYLSGVKTEYGFGFLPNGVVLSDAVRRAYRIVLAKGDEETEPWLDPDALVAEIMTVDRTVTGEMLTPLQAAILEMRPDVSKAFPGIYDSPEDVGFRNWLFSSGQYELNIERLLEVQPDIKIRDRVEKVFSTLLKFDREDVFEAFPNLFVSFDELERFCDWVRVSGVAEHSFDGADADVVWEARHGPRRILSLYIQRSDLQYQFFELTEEKYRERFKEWLFDNARDLTLTVNEISLFIYFCIRMQFYINTVVRLYKTNANFPTAPVSSIFALFQSDVENGLRDWIASWCFARIGFQISEQIDNYQIYLESQCNQSNTSFNPNFKRDIMECVNKREMEGRINIPDSFREQYILFKRSYASDMRGKESVNTINIAGYFDSPTGMGASANSMLMTVNASSYSARCFTLPTHKGRGELGPDPLYLGWASRGPVASICVANADVSDTVSLHCPPGFFGQVNIGYWVWETEDFPEEFAEVAQRFHEIWTPSAYSAVAISKRVPIPVRVLPHMIDVESVAAQRGSRDEFGLPDDLLIVLYMFDSSSVFERKNPGGALHAFREAFGERDDVLLLVKSNSNSYRGLEQYRILTAFKRQPNARIFDATLDYEATLRLISVCDVYLSLHRSEGFGLTCAEAMALGKPVVATGYSGNLEYMDEECARLIPAKRVRTPKRFGAYPAGSWWGNPDIKLAADALTSMLDPIVRQDLGEAGRRQVKRKLSPSVVSARLNHLLENAVRSSDER